MKTPFIIPNCSGHLKKNAINKWQIKQQNNEKHLPSFFLTIKIFNIHIRCVLGWNLSTFKCERFRDSFVLQSRMINKSLIYLTILCRPDWAGVAMPLSHRAKLVYKDQSLTQLDYTSECFVDHIRKATCLSTIKNYVRVAFIRKVSKN